MYPTLAKLETLGFIAKESVIQDGRPNKNVYSITEAGRQQFHAYLESPIQKDSFHSDFLVRMFFGEYMDFGTLTDWVRDELRKSQEADQQLERMKEQTESGLPLSRTLYLDIGSALNASKTRDLQEALQKLTNSD